MNQTELLDRICADSPRLHRLVEQVIDFASINRRCRRTS